MDDILKLAYAALEKWRTEVTVDDFIKDNKRLNSNRNIYSPSVREFLSHCSPIEKIEEQHVLDNDFSSRFIPLFDLKVKEELSNFEKVFDLLIASSNIQKRVDKNISSNITSIVVHFKNYEVHLDKPKESLKLEDPEGIDRFFSHTHSSSAKTKKPVESVMRHTSKMFDYASC